MGFFHHLHFSMCQGSDARLRKMTLNRELKANKRFLKATDRPDDRDAQGTKLQAALKAFES